MSPDAGRGFRLSRLRAGCRFGIVILFPRTRAHDRSCACVPAAGVDSSCLTPMSMFSSKRLAAVVRLFADAVVAWRIRL